MQTPEWTRGTSVTMESEFDKISSPEVEAPPVEEPAETAAAPEEEAQEPVAAAVEQATPEPEPAPFEIELAPGNLVVELLFLGSESYLFCPVPATGAALRRLRARSFRLAALKELIVQRVSERLGVIGLFGWNDRSLLAGPAVADWENVLRSLQRELDQWLFQHLNPAGVLQCYLAGAISPGGVVPLEPLEEQLRQRLRQPLEGALRIGPRWNGKAFVLPAGPAVSRCSGCGAVTSGHLFGEETLCDPCARDMEAGDRVPALHRAWFCPEAQSDLPGPGVGLVFVEPADSPGAPLALDAGHWPLLRRMPAEEGRVLKFEELAEKAPGARKVLGYLLVEVNGLDQAAGAAEGDPARISGLSRLAGRFFTEQLPQMLEGDFPALFPVLVTSAELLLIGPWPDTFSAAARLARGFAELEGNALTLSAGLVLAPPSVSLQGAVAEAQRELTAARGAGGNRLSAFGTALAWREVPRLLEQAKRLSVWLRQRAITAGWLETLVRLNAASREGGDVWRPLLASAIRNPRVKHGPARHWAARLVNGSGGSPDWAAIEFLARYAALAGASPASPAEPGTAESEALEPAEPPEALAPETSGENL